MVYIIAHIMLFSGDKTYFFLSFFFIFCVVQCYYYQPVGEIQCDVEEIPRLGCSKSNAKSREYQKCIIGSIPERLTSLFSYSNICYLWPHWFLQEHQFEDLLQKLLVLDSIALLANVEVLIVDEDTREELVETTGPGAQSLVDLLHAVCLQVVYTCHINISM